MANSGYGSPGLSPPGMTETLVHAYTPLLVWVSLGLLAFRFVPQSFPRLLGRGLYWVGVPLQILAFTRRTDFSQSIGWAPLMAIAALLLGLMFGWTGLRWSQHQRDRTQQSTADLADLADLAPALEPPRWLSEAPSQGSLLLSAMLGNTGFVGLSVLPEFLPDTQLGWLVFYNMTQNILGTYGLGILLSCHFGGLSEAPSWPQKLRTMLSVPSLWAFTLGVATHSVKLPSLLETNLQRSLWVVIPCALLLMGMRLSQLNGLTSLRLALLPSAIKMFVLPAAIGGVATAAGLVQDARLSMVLMAGMPTAFAGLILAEEYSLDHELIASSIALTTPMLLLTLPLWLRLFG